MRKENKRKRWSMREPYRKNEATKRKKEEKETKVKGKGSRRGSRRRSRRRTEERLTQVVQVRGDGEKKKILRKSRGMKGGKRRTRKEKRGQLA